MSCTLVDARAPMGRSDSDMSEEAGDGGVHRMRNPCVWTFRVEHCDALVSREDRRAGSHDRLMGRRPELTGLQRAASE